MHEAAPLTQGTIAELLALLPERWMRRDQFLEAITQRVPGLPAGGAQAVYESFRQEEAIRDALGPIQFHIDHLGTARRLPDVPIVVLTDTGRRLLRDGSRRAHPDSDSFSVRTDLGTEASTRSQ